ncbi:glycosyltransferase family 4 protein [Candidatus Woesearchaeota archaeon]|nr:glycosyltransferase family 4 protein [Candidatus Woesearchaeota archaeon]
MKICIVTLFYKPAGGGIPRYVDNLANSLAKLGNKIDIITASYDNIVRKEKNGKITVYALPSLNIFKKLSKECIGKSKEFLRFMKKYISKNKIDIIVAQNLHAAVSSVSHVFALNMAALEKKVPTILTIHSFPEEPFSQLKISLVKYLPWDRIITVSSAVAEAFYDQGLEVEKVKVIYPGTDTNVFRPGLGKKWLRSRIEGLRENDIVILHASRTNSTETIKAKGIPTLLKAFSIIANRFKNTKLLIASASTSPPFEKEKRKALENIEDMVKIYNIQNKVKIATFQPEEMPLVYNGCDVFVLASEVESFGLVYAEAMACELPVIGTSVGGIPEVIVNTQTGYIIPPNNPVELSKYLAILISDEEKRKKFGKEGRKVVISKFENNKIAAKRVGNYNSILYNHKNKKE